MQRERLKPTTAADELLHAAIAGRSHAALDQLRPHISTAVADAILRVMEGTAAAEDIGHLARTFEAGGLTAAALAAFSRQARASDRAMDRMGAYAEMERLERASGLAVTADGRRRMIRRLGGEGNGPDSYPRLRQDGLAVISVFAEDERFHALAKSYPLAALSEDPNRDPTFCKRHFLAADPDNDAGLAEDYSFLVAEESGVPLLRVECDTRGDLYLGCRETGIALFEMVGESPRLEAARELALRQLDLTVVWAGCPYFWLDVAADNAVPPSMAARMRDLPDSSKISYRSGWIDLSLDPASIWQAYRPTTRQRIRWGQEHMRIANDRDGSLDFPAAYRELRSRIGRDPGMPPEVLAEALAAGDIRAYAGFHQEVLSSMVLTSRHGATTYDMATVNIRSGNAPLSHILIHHAILDAKEQGQKRFHFGPLYEGGQFGAKMKSIAEFKRGFASSFEPRLLLRLGDTASR